MIRDVMQSAQLTDFPELGILIFFCAFLMILLLANFGLSHTAREQLAGLPLQPDERPPADRA